MSNHPKWLDFCSCEQTPFSSLICSFDTVTLLAFLGFLLVKTVVSIVYKSSFFSFQESFKRSIFSGLTNEDSLYNLKLYGLYFFTSYGIIIARPLGFVLSELLFRGCGAQGLPLWQMFMMIVIKALTEALYFFNVMFMIHFYGIKAEILYLKGDPAISVTERESFLKMLNNRSRMLAIIYFPISLLKLSLDPKSYTPFFETTSTDFSWSLNIIQYGFVAIIAVRRLSYINYAKKMTIQKVSKKNKQYPVTSFNKHVNDYAIPRQNIASVVSGLQVDNDEEFVREFSEAIKRSCEHSSRVFDEKTKLLVSSQEHYQPLVRNPMENYLVGLLWLTVTGVDSIINAVVAIGVIIVRFALSNTSVKEDAQNVLIWTVLVSYVAETVLQSIFCAIIIGNKENFGDYLDQGSSHPETSSRKGSEYSAPSLNLSMSMRRGTLVEESSRESLND